jgi:TonB family protein
MLRQLRNRYVADSVYCESEPNSCETCGVWVGPFGIAQDVSPPTPPKSKEPLYFPPSCTTDQPLYSNASGKPIWLSTDSLLKRARHCEPPIMPALARQSRIAGYVSIDILVNDTGKVFCVQRVTGHAMLTGSATEAAKKWTFLPKRQNGNDVWFYGRLRFRFSRGNATTKSCAVAR